MNDECRNVHCRLPKPNLSVRFPIGRGNPRNEDPVFLSIGKLLTRRTL
jgi:hypothetical protein